ncbi:diguanylate cyclase (GGDEF) domain-containing protein [Caldanaerobius fijiensis DSM 17918]|uniref:Diguanylate cyclase (GGDEF) domain-containing protein n=1 Tax=Caldanaerobius fijiensis DSM 17918 TaxID=1121256 RepID=A0A1M5CX71_9THEO|nr:GGDEF domain-containing protein [Caldanaerobius fijiensis]SHF59207.1 diguanylate cyclase (GGDEF) domain-containing protein [Caldanaerobius fijiensis DSM 17918]
MTNLELFQIKYKEYLSNYVLKGGDDEILFEAYQALINLLDDSSAQAANILDIHNRVLKDVLNIRSDIDMVQWIYIERATEFLTQILIATDALLLSLKENIEKDPLTGLYNRLALDRILSKAWSYAASHNTPLTVAMLDLDNFKHINDNYGHLVGDELLAEVCLKIKRSLRDGDEIIRYGGEEFLVLLPETSVEKALIPLERIRNQIESDTFTAEQIKTTISIGLATFPGDRPLNYEELIKFADTALYEAKSRGKNQIVSYRELTRKQ